MATTEAKFLRALGARILSEANDLKRTPAALADELGLPRPVVEAAIAGSADAVTARGVLTAMAETYSISLADIWVERDDTDHGVRVMTRAESEGSKRIFDRNDRSGKAMPYYEYRDTAMSRSAPFKPEWILELRTVADSDPYNPDVAFNRGHFLHQTTFFIGPVNFYWELGGKRHCALLDTGDSNYITPFVPHTFTSRDPDNLGLIVAVTYGAEVRRAFREFGAVDSNALLEHAGDLREPSPFALRLRRQLDAESLPPTDFLRRLEDAGITPSRARALLQDTVPETDELALIAGLLNVRESDLLARRIESADEVVVVCRGQTAERGYPDNNQPAYRLTELARSPHQPLLKGFDVTVLGGADGTMRHGLHEYLYNYGTVPVILAWDESRQCVLEPGDSAYVRPLVRHRLDRVAGAGEGRIAMIRVPGALTDSALDELAAFSAAGRGRAIEETMRWF